MIFIGRFGKGPDCAHAVPPASAAERATASPIMRRRAAGIRECIFVSLKMDLRLANPRFFERLLLTFLLYNHLIGIMQRLQFAWISEDPHIS